MHFPIGAYKTYTIMVYKMLLSFGIFWKLPNRDRETYYNTFTVDRGYMVYARINVKLSLILIVDQTTMVYMRQQDYFTYRREMAELKKRLKSLHPASLEYRAVMREITYREKNRVTTRYVTLREKMLRSLGSTKTEIREALTDIEKTMENV